MTDFEKAIQYVRDNCTFGPEEINYATKRIDLERCPLSLVAPNIAEEICDLMEEYGEDNGFSEGWWYDYGNADDVFFAL